MTLPSTDILWGLLVSVIIAGLALRQRSLSPSGAIGAVIVGTLTFTAGLEWALVLILFFVSSSLLSRMGEAQKAPAREHFSKGEERDLGQVMANGGIAATIALIFILTEADWAWAAYLGAFSTATADTWATEIGTLSRRQPRLITNMRIVEPGTSGGISALGTVGALLGTILIGVAGALLGGDSLSLVFSVIIAGMAGSFGDSLLGATLQAQYQCEGIITEKTLCADGQPAQLTRGLGFINNDVVNLCAVLLGCGVAVIL